LKWEGSPLKKKYFGITKEVSSKKQCLPDGFYKIVKGKRMGHQGRLQNGGTGLGQNISAKHEFSRNSFHMKKQPGSERQSTAKYIPVGVLLLTYCTKRSTKLFLESQIHAFSKDVNRVTYEFVVVFK